MIDWNQLKTDWKAALNNPSIANNKDTVVDAMIDALETQITAAIVTGTDSGGDTLTNGKIQ